MAARITELELLRKGIVQTPMNGGLYRIEDVDISILVVRANSQELSDKEVFGVNDSYADEKMIPILRNKIEYLGIVLEELRKRPAIDPKVLERVLYLYQTMADRCVKLEKRIELRKTIPSQMSITPGRVSITLGIWKHYKGGYYTVLGTAVDYHGDGTGTTRQVVIYLDGRGEYHIREVRDFLGKAPEAWETEPGMLTEARFYYIGARNRQGEVNGGGYHPGAPRN